jgi:exosortase/archaeosortase
MDKLNNRGNDRQMIALGLILLVGAAVLSRLLVALGVPIVLILLWVLFIRVKLFAIVKARRWWRRQSFRLAVR